LLKLEVGVTAPSVAVPVRLLLVVVSTKNTLLVNVGVSTPVAITSPVNV
jgi:hypothetical protein